jgi:hypothetical protein
VLRTGKQRADGLSIISEVSARVLPQQAGQSNITVDRTRAEPLGPVLSYSWSIWAAAIALVLLGVRRRETAAFRTITTECARGQQQVTAATPLAATGPLAVRLALLLEAR